MGETSSDSSPATSRSASLSAEKTTTAASCSTIGQPAESLVLEFVQSRIDFEKLPTERYGLADFKLDRVRSLLSRLGDPQKIPAVHIAGTKGKGSTAAMIAAIAQTAGHRVGLFTSPHMHQIGERMTVDGALPTPEELQEVLRIVRPEVEAMDREGELQRTTFFEVLTAMAWVHFRSRGVDLVVLETGMGGRLDATNVCQPLLCVITSISRDHERLLGSTLPEIAAEKAGILKTGIPAFSGVTDDAPRSVIQSVARQVEAPLYELGESIRFQSDAETLAGPAAGNEPPFATVDIETPWRSHTALRAPLAGPHQAANLSLAVAAADCLNASGWDISSAAITAGLRRVHWPLRVETIARNPLVIADAAHNVASIAALVRTLRPLTASVRVVVFGTARDKDTAGMLKQLAGAFDRVILTRFVDNPRAVSRDQLESMAQDHLQIPWTWADDPATAWQLASDMAPPDGLICVTGSFFLASEFRAVVRSATAPD